MKSDVDAFWFQYFRVEIQTQITKISNSHHEFIKKDKVISKHLLLTVVFFFEESSLLYLFFIMFASIKFQDHIVVLLQG